MLKKLLAVAAVSVLALGLAGCSAFPATTPTPSCVPARPGSASDRVIVHLSKTTIAATVPKKTHARATERTEVTAGHGRHAVRGDTVTLRYLVYNGTTGTKLDAAVTASGVTMPLNTGLLPGLYKALRCSTPGSRIVAVIPPADAFGEAGSAQLGVGSRDSLVFVVEVLGVAAAPQPTATPSPTASTVPALPRASGTPEVPPAGFPTVALAADGAPTITVPGFRPPAALEIARLQKGAGTVVAPGDRVTVHFTGVIWASGVVFDSTWSDNHPVTFQTTGVISGFGKAIVGQTVGSQIIAIVPPSEGYGAAGSPPAISGTDTLVFVIDILASSP